MVRPFKSNKKSKHTGVLGIKKQRPHAQLQRLHVSLAY